MQHSAAVHGLHVHRGSLEEVVDVGFFKTEADVAGNGTIRHASQMRGLQRTRALDPAVSFQSRGTRSHDGLLVSREAKIKLDGLESAQVVELGWGRDSWWMRDWL